MIFIFLCSSANIILCTWMYLYSFIAWCWKHIGAIGWNNTVCVSQFNNLIIGIYYGQLKGNNKTRLNQTEVAHVVF